jgi:capsular polysaccharide transport system permease protein
VSEDARLRRSAWGQFLYEIDEGARRQANVIFALIFKEFRTKSHRSSLAHLAWVLAEPGVGTVVLSLFWYLARRQTIAGVNVALFLLISFMTFAIIRHGTGDAPRALKTNEAFYAFQQVKPIDAIIAHFVLDWVLLMVGSALMLFLLYWFFDLTIRTDALLQAAAVILVTTAAGFGISLLIATYSALYGIVGQIVGMSGRVLIFVSCVLHDGGDLPASLRAIIAWNPIANMEEFIRYYILGVPLIPEVSMSYMWFTSLGFLSIGLISYYANRFRLLRQ